jgi:hypothetical protein
MASGLTGAVRGFTLTAPGGWPALQPRARLPLIVAALSGRGGCGGRIARRRRGPEGLRAAGGAEARNVPPTGLPVTGGSCAASRSTHPARGACQELRPAVPGALRAPLMIVKKVLTAPDWMV